MKRDIKAAIKGLGKMGLGIQPKASGGRKRRTTDGKESTKTGNGGL